MHQQDSSQPQQSQDSPQLIGLGLTIVEMDEAALAGILAEILSLLLLYFWERYYCKVDFSSTSEKHDSQLNSGW